MGVRFWALAQQPGGLFPDEAAEGLSAQRLLTQPGYHPVFFDDDGGREALYAYIVAGVFRFFGASVLTLRETAAAVGVLGVIATFIAVRRFGRGAALAAMAWSAGSLWLICVSRDGFRNVIAISAGSLVLAALLRWGDRPGRGTAVLAGAAIGIAGFWTYQPLKLLPVLALVWVLWMRRRDRDRYRALRPTLGWAEAAFLIAVAPMLWTAITDPGNYFGRALAVSAIGAGGGAPESFPVHVLRTFGMFLATGDPNQRHDAYALPLLGPLLFVPWALGVWRAWKRRRDAAHALVLFGLVVFLLPPLLATESEAPHFLRSLGLEPYVAACIGLGCLEIASLARRAARRAPGAPMAAATPVAWAACAVAIAGAGVASALTYVNRPIELRYGPYSFADVALATASAGGPATVVIIDDYDAIDVRFLDFTELPTIVAPNRRIPNPAVYSKIVASTREQIAAATSSAIAALAQPVAFDPQGDPVVFTVVPQ